jgi:phage terminase large subunit-like protein
MPTKLNAFKNKQLNIWTDAAMAWVSSERWRACAFEQDLEALKGKRCYIGIDLAEVCDLSAVVYLFPPQEGVERLTAVLKVWIPDENIRDRSKRDKVPYEVWKTQGYVHSTPGNVTDFDFIEAEILKDATLYDVVEIAYDPWKATQTAIHLQDAGLELVPVRQGYKSLSAPVKELERLLIKEDFNHLGNPVFAWACGNVVATQDPTGAVKFDKAKSRERIDPMAALINAIARYLEEEDPGSVYAEQEVRTL